MKIYCCGSQICPPQCCGGENRDGFKSEVLLTKLKGCTCFNTHEWNIIWLEDNDPANENINQMAKILFKFCWTVNIINFASIVLLIRVIFEDFRERGVNWTIDWPITGNFWRDEKMWITVNKADKMGCVGICFPSRCGRREGRWGEGLEVWQIERSHDQGCRFLRSNSDQSKFWLRIPQLIQKSSLPKFSPNRD